MKKRVILKTVAIFLLILLAAGCNSSKENSQSVSSDPSSKANSIEQKIVGKWSASIG